MATQHDNVRGQKNSNLGEKHLLDVNNQEATDAETQTAPIFDKTHHRKAKANNDTERSESSHDEDGRTGRSCL